MNRIKKTFSKSFFRASVVVALFVVSLGFVPVNNMPVYATTVQDLDSQIQTKKTEAQSLESEIASFDNQIQQLSTQIQSTQNNVDETNSQIEDTQKKIKTTEENLKTQRDALNEYLRVIYEESNTSTLELVAGSNNFSDFVDKTEYLQTMQMKVKDMVEKIKALRAELEQKKRDLENKRSDLNSLVSKLSLQNGALNNQKTAKDTLLSQTNSQITDLAAQRAHLIILFNESLGSGSSDYPYGSPVPADQVDTADDWGYLKGECTSYAAFWRSTHGKPIPRNLGNAKDWASIASHDGPQVGDVMVFPNIYPYGHVAIVTGVDSGLVSISEYNWPSPMNDNRWYSFNKRSNVNPANYGAVFIH